MLVIYAALVITTHVKCNFGILRVQSGTHTWEPDECAIRLIKEGREVNPSISPAHNGVFSLTVAIS